MILILIFRAIHRRYWKWQEQEQDRRVEEAQRRVTQ